MSLNAQPAREDDESREIWERHVVIDGKLVRILSSRLDDRYVCTIDDLATGELIARASGHVRAEVEISCIARASDRLARAKCSRDTLRELRASVLRLDAVLPSRRDD